MKKVISRWERRAAKCESTAIDASSFMRERKLSMAAAIRDCIKDLRAASITPVQGDARFDPVCRKCGDPLVSYELVCDDCRRTP